MLFIGDFEHSGVKHSASPVLPAFAVAARNASGRIMMSLASNDSARWHRRILEF